MLPLCCHKNCMVAQSKDKWTSLSFVSLQMPKFVAVTEGSNHFCCYSVADVYFLTVGEHRQPGVQGG